MAYVASNPPRLMVPSMGGGPQFWVYTSADDDGTVNGSNYISNAEALGMRKGDLVYVYDTNTPKGSLHYVSNIDDDGNGTLAFAAVA